MTSAAPTVLALETDSAWVVILAVSIVTLIAALALRRLVGRPGGFASGLLLSLPLVMPLLAALVYHHAVLPEIAVLQPAGEAVMRGRGLMHLLLLAERDGTMTPYALSGSAGYMLLWVGIGVSSFMLLRRFFGMVMVHRLVVRCTPATDAEVPGLVRVVEEMAQRAGLRHTPEVLLLPDGASGAFAVRGRHGRILISTDLLDSLDEEEIQGIVAHEVAHLKARDLQVLFTAGLLRDMVAWNPIAHVAYRRLARDREFEADRRAAAMTGHPLAVASGLLRAFQVTRKSTGYGQRFALAFFRPRGLVRRRVVHLLQLADGRTFDAPARALPYVMAACLVAVMGLQAAARVSSDGSSAFAFVWNEPATSTRDVWAPRKVQPAVKPALKGDPRKWVPLPRPDVVYSIQSRHLDKWVRAMTYWAKKQKVTPALERWRTRESWAATRVATTVGGLGVYRIKVLGDLPRF